MVLMFDLMGLAKSESSTRNPGANDMFADYNTSGQRLKHKIMFRTRTRRSFPKSAMLPAAQGRRWLWCQKFPYRSLAACDNDKGPGERVARHWFVASRRQKKLPSTGTKVLNPKLSRKYRCFCPEALRLNMHCSKPLT